MNKKEIKLRIVVGTYEGLLYGWEGELSKEIQNKKINLNLKFGYAAHPNSVKCVKLFMNTNKNMLLSGSNDETIKIYDVDKKKEIGSLMEQGGAITCLENFKNKNILSGSADNTICIWRTSDWNCLHVLGGHKDEITGIAIHPSGKLAMSVSNDKTLRMWNLVKGRCGYIKKLNSKPSSIFISNDGNRFGYTIKDIITIYDSQNGQLLFNLTHPTRVCDAKFIINNCIISVGEDKYIYMWNKNGELVSKITHSDINTRIRCFDVISFNNEKDNLPFLITSSTDGVIQIWNLNELKQNIDTPEDQTDVVPTATTKINSTTRVTCITAILLEDNLSKNITNHEIQLLNPINANIEPETEEETVVTEKKNIQNGLNRYNKTLDKIEDTKLVNRDITGTETNE